MRISPAVGCSKPAIRRRQVVLPEPEGPSSAKNSPSAISKLTLSAARTSPKWRLTLWKATAGEGDSDIQWATGLHANPASFDRLRMRTNFGGTKKDPHPELVEGRTVLIQGIGPALTGRDNGGWARRPSPPGRDHVPLWIAW